MESVKILLSALVLGVAACRPPALNSTTATIAAVPPDRPSPRSAAGLVFDSRRSRLVLFGGSDSTYQPLADTWEWSGNRWTRLAAEAPARSNFAMAFDSRRGRVVVFGGSTRGGRAHDTWEFDGARWTQVDTGGPPARNLVSMAFDEARGRMVLFGGAGLHESLRDTWEWDGTSWHAIQIGDSGPSGRGSYTLVFDAGRRRVVLIGGYADNPTADSWEWDGTAWHRLADGPAVFHHAAAYDRSSNRLLVFGGFIGDQRSANLWARTGDAWTLLHGEGPPARAEHRGTFATGIGFVIFGGIGGQGMSLEDRRRSMLNDLWAFDGTRWHELGPSLAGLSGRPRRQ
jgi:hypothetical protein